MSLDSLRPEAFHAEASSGIRGLVNGIAFYGIFGFGLLFPLALPAYAYLTR